MVKIFLLHDTEERHITPGIFKLLKTGRPVQEYLVKFLKHPAVGSQQFARIINASLSSKTLDKSIKNALISVTSTSDIHDLRRIIVSEDLQRAFLGFLGLKDFKHVDVAWKRLKLREKTRDREWFEKRATPIFKRVKQIQDSVFLIDHIYWLISQYAV